MRHLCLMALLLLAALLSGCAAAQPLWVELRGERYIVEVADDDASRARGLMFRESLADGHGMLFIHERPQRQAFWMKNTLIPLDILYFDAELRLVSVSERAVPCREDTRCRLYPSRGPALYTLELNAGEAERLGVSPGDTLELSPALRERPSA